MPDLMKWLSYEDTIWNVRGGRRRFTDRSMLRRVIRMCRNPFAADSIADNADFVFRCEKY